MKTESKPIDHIAHIIQMVEIINNGEKTYPPEFSIDFNKGRVYLKSSSHALLDRLFKSGKFYLHLEDGQIELVKKY